MFKHEGTAHCLVVDTVLNELDEHGPNKHLLSTGNWANPGNC
jgi:hypothetical protein